VSVLIGRDDVVHATQRLLDPARRQPSALALEGEAGMGKTAVWLHAVAAAAAGGHRVLQARPAENETGLAYLGITDLVGPVFDEVRSALPPPQSRALAAALLLGGADDEHVELRAVATGFTTVLTELAAVGRVLVAVDDVQWLDPASARVLDFVARRLPDRVKLLLAARVTLGTPSPTLLALPDDVLEHVVLPPLSLAALRQLVLNRVGISLSRPLLTRLTTASAGNPLFVLEICRALLIEEGEPGPNEPLPVPSTLQRLVRTRVAALSASAQEALLVAAALSRPTATDVVQAVGTEGDQNGETGLAEALGAEIVGSENGRIRFTHPLFASAVYGAAAPERRRALHQQLAEVVTDVDERARHLAVGVDVPDAAVAAELEQAAVRATLRGAQDTAAEQYAASSRLTPPALDDLRARRLLGEAAARNATGGFAAARGLAQQALGATSDATIRTATLSLLGSIEWFDGDAEAATRLVERAVEVSGSDRRLLGPLHAELVRLNFSWDLRSALEHAARAKELLDEDRDTTTLAAVLVDELFGSALRGQRVPKGLRDRALELEARSLAASGPPHPMVLLWLHCTDDLAAARERCAMEEGWYRDRGEDVWVADRLSHLAVAELHAGDLESAELHAERSCAAVEHLAVGGPRAMVFEKRSLVDAHRGRLDRGRATLQSLLADHENARQDWWSALTLSTLAFVEFVAGDFHAADAALVAMREKADRVGVVDVLFDRSEPFHIEALLALGRAGDARAALERLEERAGRLPRPWITASLPRARALVAAEEGDLPAALAPLDVAADGPPSGLPLEDAWTLLVKGRIERRARQKRAAADSLGRALDVFERIGATTFVDRTRRDLARVGLRRSAPTALTPTERLIAGHAAGGMTNLEIAQAAFVTTKTVEANLTKVYRKLGIRSRAQLSEHLARADEGSAPQT
jgi:DNA-binding CsgD family transcriptional regulator